MTLKEICKFITAHSSLVLGDTLVYGHREAEDKRRCAVVAERNVGESDFYLPDKITKSVSITTRSESYDEASTDADAIHSILHGYVGWDLPVINSGIRYHVQVIMAVGLPVYIGQDESGMHEIICNYDFKIQQI